jgi:hypothetical protein
MSTPDAPYTYAQTTLVRASPAQTLFTRKDTFPLWGQPKGFDLEMYLKRDEMMEKEEWSVGGGFVTWSVDGMDKRVEVLVCRVIFADETEGL